MSRKPAKRKVQAKGPGVVLAGPNPGTVDASFFGSVTALLLHDANHREAVTKFGGCIWLESSPRIFAARCDIVGRFLEDTGHWEIPPEWLFFIDADMTFEPTALDEMLEVIEAGGPNGEEIKILGGLCFAGGRGKRAYPTLFTVANPEEFDPNKPLLLDKHLSYPGLENEEEAGLVKVNATGGSFLMIHRDVLEAMLEAAPENEPYPWFKEYIQAGVPFGEDIFFGLRAGSLGFSTWIHTGIRTGHRKTYTLDEDHYRKNHDAYVKAMEAP